MMEVLYCPPGDTFTALDSVAKIVEALSELLKKADSQVAQGIPNWLDEIQCATFVPGMESLVRGVTQIGVELAAEREWSYSIVSGQASGVTALLALVLRLRGAVGAITAALSVLLDAVEREVTTEDRATAALFAGVAFVDAATGLVIARAGNVDNQRAVGFKSAD